MSNNKIIILSLIRNGEVINIVRTKDWEINITQLALKFGKKWKAWKWRNKQVIADFELLEGKSMVRESGPKNKVQTWLSFKLAMRVLSSYDNAFSWHVFSKFVQSMELDKVAFAIELDKVYKMNEILTAKNAKLEGKSIEVDLVGGDYLSYGYSCNKQVKFGNSFKNKNGQRPKSHKTAVPKLAIGFIIYSSKENLQTVNSALKKRYNITNRKEHLPEGVSVKDVENFMLDYMRLMNFEFKRECIHTLTLLNIYLQS